LGEEVPPTQPGAVRRLGLRFMHRPRGGTLRCGIGVKSNNAIAGFYRRTAADGKRTAVRGLQARRFAASLRRQRRCAPVFALTDAARENQPFIQINL